MSLQDRLCSARHEPPDPRPGIWLSASVGALTGGVVALWMLFGGAW